MACRVDDPKIHTMVSLRHDDPLLSNPHSTRIYQDGRHDHILYLGFQSRISSVRFPPLLYTCVDSRKVTQVIYTYLPYTPDPLSSSWFDRYHHHGSGITWPESYFNTLFDAFYMGNAQWDEFKLLVDFLMQRNSTRPLAKLPNNQLQEWKKIRHLAVNMNIFSNAPASLWTEFSCLETLTIVFYPYENISDVETIVVNEELDNYENALPKFLQPTPGLIHGKRAAWIMQSVTKYLNALR